MMRVHLFKDTQSISPIPANYPLSQRLAPNDGAYPVQNGITVPSTVVTNQGYYPAVFPVCSNHHTFEVGAPNARSPYTLHITVYEPDDL